MNYTFTKDEAHCRLFFGLPADTRKALIDKVSFVYETDGFIFGNGDNPINEIYLSEARKNRAETILVPANITSVQQVREAQKNGFKVCFIKADNIDAIVNGLLLSPDCILINRDYDIEALCQFLLSVDSSTIEPIARQIDLSIPGEYTINSETVSLRPNGTELRVISFNILAPLWNHRPQVAPRAEAIISALHRFTPDLGGLQEAEAIWYKALNDKIAPFDFVKLSDDSLQSSISPRLIYDTRKFRQIEAGLIPYTDSWLRCLHWAVLEEIESGRRLILTNTHWDLTSGKRMENAKLMEQYLADLKARFNLPVICTGDFNCVKDSPEFEHILNAAALRDAIFSSPYKENDMISSHFNPRYYTSPCAGSNLIDHVLTSCEFEPLAARFVLDKKLMSASDHLPLIADFKWGQSGDR